LKHCCVGDINGERKVKELVERIVTDATENIKGFRQRYL
jgi:hypothetical protein